MIVPLKIRAPAAATPAALPEPPMPEIVVTSSLHRIEYTAVGTHTIVDKELAGRIPVSIETQRLPDTRATCAGVKKTKSCSCSRG